MRLTLPALASLLFFGPIATPYGQAPSPPAPYTFRIYEDLVQLPTLVLETADTSYPNLRAGDFTLAIDGGPAFHPRHVRLQGDDPISLTLLLDLSTASGKKLAQQIAATAGGVPNEWLQPQDHISVFAVDCSLIRSTFDAPFSSDVLQAGVRAALASPLLKSKPPNRSGCDSSRLWDTIAGVIKQVSQLPGRRVVLAVTNGLGHHSAITWRNLEVYAGQFSLTLIGLRPLGPLILLRSQPGGIGAQTQNEDVFQLLCYGTGGTLLAVDNDLLSSQLQRAVTLLRQRYILEFARPANGTIGLHAVEVHVPDTTATVRPAGITFPIQDKTLAASPSTLASDPSRAPIVGDRKILTQKR